MHGVRQERSPDRRGSGALGVAAWTALCAAGLAALYAAWRDRLPDPMASHFALDGAADGYLAPAGWIAVGLGLLAGLGAMFCVLLVVGGRTGRRRAGVAAGSGVPALLTVIFVLNLRANLDLAEGGDARLSPWLIGVALAVGAAVAAVAWWLAGPDPDLAPAAPAAAGGMELAEGESVTWSRVADSRGMSWLAGALGLAGLLLLVSGEWVVALVLLGCALPAGAGARVLVVVDRRGLRVSPFGLPFPGKRIALSQLESAAGREVSALSEFGGWGYRVRPGASGVVLRSGPALSVRLRGGREFVVTVADADTAAALLNELIARHRRGQGD